MVIRNIKCMLYNISQPWQIGMPVGWGCARRGGRRKLVISLLELARCVFVEYLVGNLVELHVPGVRDSPSSRSREACGQG